MVTTRMPVAWMIDPAGAIRGQITYTKCTTIPRYNDVGTWRVEALLTATHFQAAAAGWRVIIDDESGLSGGPVAEAELTLKGRDLTLVLSGVDDVAWLKYSLAWPTPTAPVGSQADPYDVRTDPASTVLMEYLAVNRGPTATDSTRRIPGLTIASDPHLGAEVTGRARFDEMLKLFQGLAVSGGIGFRTIPSIGSTFQFDVYEPPDLLGVARFGLALGNLTSVKWRLTAPTATQIIGGGRGEEEAREFISITNIIEDNHWGRREGFFDYRSAADDDGGAELEEGTQRRLDESAATTLVEIEPRDGDRMKFGTGYQLGSQVTIDVYAGITVEAIIREVEITATRGDSDGPVRKVTPRVGDLGATMSDRQSGAMRDALARIAALETRR